MPLSLPLAGRPRRPRLRRLSFHGYPVHVDDVWGASEVHARNASHPSRQKERSARRPHVAPASRAPFELPRATVAALQTLAFVLVVLGGCSSKAHAPAPGGAGSSTAAGAIAGGHSADRALRELAAAFERKDAEAVCAQVSDGWSGSRFLTSWTDEQWRGAAAALRGATVKSVAEGERMYSVTVDNQARDVVLRLVHGAWMLDYNAFLGPFPHE